MNPEKTQHWQLIKAVQNGSLADVKTLIEKHQINPARWDNEALEIACDLGDDDINLEIIKYLLEDSRVDPSQTNNTFIRLACGEGYSEVARLLLQDSRVDPSVNDNHCIVESSFLGNVEIVKLLLKHPKVNPAARRNAAICSALTYSSHDVVEVLLRDPRVDPTENLTWLKSFAQSAFRSFEIYVNGLKQLLRDDRILKLDFEALCEQNLLTADGLTVINQFLEDLVKQKAASAFCCKMIGDVWPDLVYVIGSRMNF